MSCERCAGNAQVHRPNCSKVIDHPALHRREIAFMVGVIEAMNQHDKCLDTEGIDAILKRAIEIYLENRTTLGLNCAAERAYLEAQGG